MTGRGKRKKEKREKGRESERKKQVKDIWLLPATITLSV